MKKLILLHAVIITLAACSLQNKPTGHTCPFPLCPMKSNLIFTGCGDCAKGSDCYKLDSVHFIHPAWSYDQCDENLFKNECKLR